MPYIPEAGKVAFALMLLGLGVTIRDILKGTVRPNRATWAIWTLLGLIILLSYRGAVGSPETIWVVRATFLVPLTLFLFSLYRGQPGSRLLDRVCLGLALPCFPIMLVSPRFSLVLGLAIDAVGLLPTIKKAYLIPQSESRFGWTCGFVGAVINLFAVEHWTCVVASHPVYMVIIHAIVTPLLWIPRTVSTPVLVPVLEPVSQPQKK